MSAVGDGRPLGDPTLPLVPLDEAPGSSGHHEPLDYSLLDLVDDGVQRMAVTLSSPKSQRLRDFETLVTAKQSEHQRMVQEAQQVIDQAKAEALQALKERDKARVAIARTPPGPSPLPPVPITPTHAPPPHHPLPFAPPISGPTFLSARGPMMTQ